MIMKYNDKLRFALNIGELFEPREVNGTPVIFYEYGKQIDSIQPVKELIEMGVHVHFEGGSGSNHPMKMMKYAVTRTDDNGKVIAPAQAIDRATALKMITVNAAVFIEEQDNLGTLEPGKWADMVVLNGDYMAVPEDQLDKLDIDLTYVAGKQVFDASLMQE